MPAVPSSDGLGGQEDQVCKGQTAFKGLEGWGLPSNCQAREEARVGRRPSVLESQPLLGPGSFRPDPGTRLRLLVDAGIWG